MTLGFFYHSVSTLFLKNKQRLLLYIVYSSLGLSNTSVLIGLHTESYLVCRLEVNVLARNLLPLQYLQF